MTDRPTHTAPPITICRCGHTGDGPNSCHGPSNWSGPNNGLGRCLLPYCSCCIYTFARYATPYEIEHPRTLANPPPPTTPNLNFPLP